MISYADEIPESVVEDESEPRSIIHAGIRPVSDYLHIINDVEIDLSENDMPDPPDPEEQEEDPDSAEEEENNVPHVTIINEKIDPLPEPTQDPKGDSYKDDDTFGYIFSSGYNTSTGGGLSGLSSDHIAGILNDISLSVGRIDRQIYENGENDKNFYSYNTVINEDEREYKKGIFSILSSIADSISVNDEPLNISVSVNHPDPVSDNVAGNKMTEEKIEIISCNHEGTVSQGDLETIHKDLKNIFYVMIVATAFLTIIAATAFEQMIFRRMRS